MPSLGSASANETHCWRLEELAPRRLPSHSLPRMLCGQDVITTSFLSSTLSTISETLPSCPDFFSETLPTWSLENKAYLNSWHTSLKNATPFLFHVLHDHAERKDEGFTMISCFYTKTRKAKRVGSINCWSGLCQVLQWLSSSVSFTAFKLIRMVPVPVTPPVPFGT